MMNLSDRVVSQIQEAIINGDYVPGRRLPTEGEMAQLLNVSRTVIRDAFRTLSSIGLVIIRQGDGTYVAEPDDQQVRRALALRLQRSDLTMGDVIDARATVESAMAHEAALTGEVEDWDHMERAFDQFSLAVRHEEWVSAHAAHLRFHLGIFEALHQPAVSITMQPMHELILISSLPPEIGRTELWEVDLHVPMLAALRSGDATAARDATRLHYEYIKRPAYSQFRRTLFRDAHSLPSFGPVIGSYTNLDKSLADLERAHAERSAGEQQP